MYNSAISTNTPVSVDGGIGLQASQESNILSSAVSSRSQKIFRTGLAALTPSTEKLVLEPESSLLAKASALVEGKMIRASRQNTPFLSEVLSELDRNGSAALYRDADRQVSLLYMRIDESRPIYREESLAVAQAMTEDQLNTFRKLGIGEEMTLLNEAGDPVTIKRVRTREAEEFEAWKNNPDIPKRPHMFSFTYRNGVTSSGFVGSNGRAIPLTDENGRVIYEATETQPARTDRLYSYVRISRDQAEAVETLQPGEETSFLIENGGKRIYVKKTADDRLLFQSKTNYDAVPFGEKLDVAAWPSGRYPAKPSGSLRAIAESLKAEELEKDIVRIYQPLQSEEVYFKFTVTADPFTSRKMKRALAYNFLHNTRSGYEDPKNWIRNGVLLERITKEEFAELRQRDQSGSYDTTRLYNRYDPENDNPLQAATDDAAGYSYRFDAWTPPGY